MINITAATPLSPVKRLLICEFCATLISLLSGLLLLFMTQIKLTNDHIKLLKAKAHHLNPVMIMGDKGLTENFVEETRRALAHHELIKVKVAGDKAERDALVKELIQVVDAQLVQQIGRMAVLFKRNHEAPKIMFDSIK